MSVLQSEESVIIPPQAVQVKVTNVVNPYFIRLYEILGRTEKENTISRKLQSYMMNDLKETKDYVPKIGDHVILESANVHDRCIDLPAWWCRAIVTRLHEDEEKCDVLLVDYGISIEWPLDTLFYDANQSVNDKPITSTVSLYNILPAAVFIKKSSNKNVTVTVLEKWSHSAIVYTRELIQASTKTFFHCTHYLKKGDRKFGNLYLTINKKIVSLSNALISSLNAVQFSQELQTNVDNMDYESSNEGLPIFSMINGDSEIIQTNGDETNFTDQDKEKSDDLLNQDNLILSIKNLKLGPEEKQQNGLSKTELLIQNRKNRSKDDVKVLVSSKFDCKPLEVAADARFSFGIHKVLRNHGVTKLRRIQKYMWPAITEGLNVVAVSAPKSGKTLGYIAPLLSNLAADDNQEQKRNRPVAMILCSSSNEVLNVHEVCLQFLEQYPHIKSVAAFNGKSDRTLLAHIFNGCDILISTPPFMLRFMDTYQRRNIFNLRNLSHLVIDNADIVLDKYTSSLKHLILKYHIISEESRNALGKAPMQIIAAAQLWTLNLRKFVKKWMDDTYVCIGSYMEAAAFSGFQAKAIGVRSTHKNEKVTELLEHYSTVRTMIVCLKEDEAIELNEFLKSTKSMKTLLVHEKMFYNEIDEARDNWNKAISGVYPIIVCTDDVLSGLNISNVDLLIHYSVTLSSKGQFYFRFSVLMDHWYSEPSKEDKVVILIDETNDQQLEGLTSIMQRLCIQLPMQWKDVVERVAATLDRKKSNYPICDSIKSLGFCPEKNTCPYRHCILDKVDAPQTSLSVGDTVKLMVTYVTDAVHFSARVVEYQKSGSKDMIKMPSAEFININLEIQKYFLHVKNRRMHTNVEVGDICIYEKMIDNFVRVQVLNVTEYENTEKEKDKPYIVEVRCIDTGSTFTNVLVFQLLNMPEHIAKMRTHIVEVFLTNLAPYDDEYKWNHLANVNSEKWFKKFLTDKSTFVYAKVQLHVGLTIWVDTLEIRSKLLGYADLVNSCLKTTMRSEKHALDNPNHLPQLLNLCIKGGLTNINGYHIDKDIDNDKDKRPVEDVDEATNGVD